MNESSSPKSSGEISRQRIYFSGICGIQNPAEPVPRSVPEIYITPHTEWTKLSFQPDGYKNAFSLDDRHFKFQVVEQHELHLWQISHLPCTLKGWSVAT